MKRGLWLAVVCIMTACHSVRQIESGDKDVVNAYVNQARTVPIPFQRCFKAEAELEANAALLQFQPTRVGLSTQKSFSLKEEGTQLSVLEELRTPNSFKHRSLLVFEGFLMAFLAPNVMLVVEETRDGFRLQNKYYLQNLERHDQFRLYQLENRAVLVVFNKNRIYLLNKIDYEDYQLPAPSTILHLEQTGNSLEFYAAETLNGLAHYRLDPSNKKVELVRRFGQEHGLSYVVDLSLRRLSSGVAYVLDAEKGLIQLQIQTGKTRVLVAHRSCESFDTLGEEHFVLLCQSQGHSTVIEAYRYQDARTKEYKYRKLEPLFQANYLNDLHLTDQYYIVYSYKSLHVFWNTQKNRLPQTLETQSELIIPALETFALRTSDEISYLYTVEAGKLNKYELREQSPTLSLRSHQPLQKAFKLYLYGSCADLEGGQANEGSKVQACRITKNISFRVTEEEYPHKQDVNISASIVVILMTAFALVFWICLKKYKGLEQEARRILENYQKKKTSQRRAI